jgi:hypothetical protein
MAFKGYRYTVALAALAIMTGCAGRAPTQPATLTNNLAPANTTPAYTAPATPTTTPAYGNTAPLTGLPGQVGMGASGSLGYTEPGYAVQNGGMDAGTMSGQPALTARIDKKKNGVFLGLGKFKVSVIVTNPGTVAQSGLLKVSITDKGKVLKDFTERVTLQPGESQTKDYEDKRWKADNATVTVTTEAPEAFAY